MDFDCLLSEEPIDKLVAEYIELEVKEAESNAMERSKKEVKLVNSLLVALNAQKQGLKVLLTQVQYWLEVNENDKKGMDRAGKLFNEVIRRSQHLLLRVPPAVVQEIVTLAHSKAFTAVCSNSFIALLQTIASRLNLLQHKKMTLTFINFLLSPKLLTATYRQETRLCLYRMYLRVLSLYDQLKQWVEMSTQQAVFIEKCINSGGGEKDPRNIGMVFEMYLKMFEVFPENKLLTHRTTIFENLEAYYPIEFVGEDDQHQNKQVNLKEISSLLDQCLCHAFFKQQTWELFLSKTAAPPIAPFVPTILLYLSQRKKDTPVVQLIDQLRDMVVRFSDDEFIGEEHSRYLPDLGSIFAAIFDIIFCSETGVFNVKGYEVVMKWLETMVGKVLGGDCKYGGSLMSIFRSIVKKNNNPRFKMLVELFRNYTLRKLLNHLKEQDGLVPRLGLTIIALEDLKDISPELKEVVALVVLQIGKLYDEVTDQVKMLLLKILLYVFRGGPQNRVMVRNTNDGLILKDILSRAEWAFSNTVEGSQLIMVKAFIEFVAVVYTNKHQELLAHIKGGSIELETYFLCRMMQTVISEEVESSEKRKAIVEKFSLLISKINTKEHKEEMFRSLRAVPLSTCGYLLGSADWSHRQGSFKLYVSLIIQIKKYFRNKQDGQEFDSFIKKYQTELNNKLIISYLNSQSKSGQNVSKTILQTLTEQLSGSQQVYFPSLQQIRQLRLELFSFQHSFAEGYEPTLIQWVWEHLSSIETHEPRIILTGQLIQYLPQKILLRDSKQILQVLVQGQQDTSSLLKIVKHLQFEALKQTGIVSFCLSEVQSMCKGQQSQKSTDRAASILAVLIDMLEKDQQDYLKGALLKMKKELGQLLLNKKRPIRQAVRRILLLSQE